MNSGNLTTSLTVTELVIVTGSPQPYRFLGVIRNLYSSPGRRLKASNALIGVTPSLKKKDSKIYYKPYSLQPQ